jgi:multiple sugar transport system ATP-binding protein
MKRPAVSTISLVDVTKVFDDSTVAVDNLSLDVTPGELLVLLGPSGCGKSTVLRMIAGLEIPTKGQIKVGGVEVEELPVHERRVSMIFQDYALYPHMTVRDNIAFPLKIKKLPPDEIDERVTAMAEHLGIGDLLDRRPAKLSGGQRQRVAMGRAIIRKPSVFLMDEPLSNVDLMLRARLRAEIADMVRELGVTTVYVTHDQVEAMTMADRVAILRDGVLQQVGTPGQVYDTPETTYVAAFLGLPRINLFAAYVYVHLDTKVALHLGWPAEGPVLSVPWSDPRARTLAHYHGEPIVVGIRADALSSATFGLSDVPGSILQGRLRFVEHHGHESIGYLDIGASQVVVDGAAEKGIDHRPMVDVAVRFPPYPNLAPGDAMPIRVAMDQLHFFEKNGWRIHFRSDVLR